MEIWEHGKQIKFGELAWHNGLGFFCWGEIPQNTQEMKMELFPQQFEPMENQVSFEAFCSWNKWCKRVLAGLGWLVGNMVGVDFLQKQKKPKFKVLGISYLT
jgi:hypothetical protein